MTRKRVDRSSMRSTLGTFLRVSAVALLMGSGLLAACGNDNKDDEDSISIDPDAGGGDNGGAETGGTDVAVKLDGMECAPGEADGCVSATDIKRCAADGSGWLQQTCYSATGAITQCLLAQPGVPTSAYCTGCGQGERRCDPKDTTKVQECDGNGKWQAADQCKVDDGKSCFNGLCQRACDFNVKANSYIGCAFWATDLDNAFVSGGKRGYYDAAGAQYSVVVSNPSDKLVGDLKIERPDIGEVTNDDAGNKLDLSPLKQGEVRVFNLPKFNINGTVQQPLAYKISSSVPITAYQFNPLENVDVFSNDASLLLPGELMGKYYMVMSREQSFSVLRGFVTVVATKAGETKGGITFSKTTGKTLASGDGSIKVYKSGESAEFTLKQWDTLNIETDEVGSDLTGTVIVASKQIAVWAGSEAANAPNTNHCDISTCSAKDLAKGNLCGVCAYDAAHNKNPANVTKCFKNEQCSAFITCCADHLEMQMFPVKIWGSHYAAVKLKDRGKEADYWRILAAEDGTKITTSPQVKDMNGKSVYVPVLNKGEWFEIETRMSFEIIARFSDGKKAPIMVGHFMASQDAPDPNSVGPQPDDAGTGDPAFLLAIPIEQWRTDYAFLTPNKYSQNFISIAAPVNAKVALDGTPVGADFWEKLSKKYKMTRIFVAEGAHKVKSDLPVAVDVYGFDQYVSYGYPAGLDLKDLMLVKEPGEQ